MLSKKKMFPIFDAPGLVADIRRIVREAKDRENVEITQPGTTTSSRP